MKTPISTPIEAHVPVVDVVEYAYRLKLKLARTERTFETCARIGLTVRVLVYAFALSYSLHDVNVYVSMSIKNC